MTDPTTARAELGSQVMQSIAAGTLDQSVLPLDVRRAVTAVRDADTSAVPYCLAAVKDEGRWWSCALLLGHGGDHEARHIDRGVQHTWPQDAPPCGARNGADGRACSLTPGHDGAHVAGAILGRGIAAQVWTEQVAS